MTTNESFTYLTSLLKRDKSECSPQKFSINLTDNDDQSLIKSCLEDFGYEFDDAATIRKKMLNISLSSDMWKSDCPIFQTWKVFFNNIEYKEKIPSFYFILDDSSNSLDIKYNHNLINLFFESRRLIISLSDHFEPPSGITKGYDNTVFIIEAEDKVRKHSFKPKLEWEQISIIGYDEENLNSFSHLIKCISLSDNQDQERKKILKLSLSEVIIGTANEADIFKTIVKNGTLLKKKYHEHYELYLNKFSINKTIKEISDQDLNYTSKINEIVSSIQNKALTIPGALIAIGAIMKLNEVLDALAVVVGMIMTTAIVYRSLKVHQKTINHLQKQVNSEFKRYDILNEKAEIRIKANETKAELIKLINDAQKNSSFIETSILSILAVSIIYIALSIIPKIP